MMTSPFIDDFYIWYIYAVMGAGVYGSDVWPKLSFNYLPVRKGNIHNYEFFLWVSWLYFRFDLRHCSPPELWKICPCHPEQQPSCFLDLEPKVTGCRVIIQTIAPTRIVLRKMMVGDQTNDLLICRFLFISCCSQDSARATVAIYGLAKKTWLEI